MTEERLLEMIDHADILELQFDVDFRLSGNATESINDNIQDFWLKDLVNAEAIKDLLETKFNDLYISIDRMHDEFHKIKNMLNEIFYNTKT